MPFVKIDVPPGMYLNGTEYGAAGRWRLGNLVRFFRGEPQPIGGWVGVPLDVIADEVSVIVGDIESPGGSYPILTTVTPSVGYLEGTCRGIISWRDNSETKWMAFGTTRKLYAFDGTTLYDITPTGLGVGEENQFFGEGFGALDYGEEEYGTPRSASGASIVEDPGAWTLDVWGENLIACANWKGLLYQWDPNTPSTVAEEIDDGSGEEVPQQCRAVLVSNERHLIALGAGEWTGVVWQNNRRRVAWSTSEDLEEWTPSATNSAGDLQLNTNGLIVCGAKFRNEILIWTDVDLHRMTYIGAPYFYSIKPVASGAGIVSVQAYVVTNQFVFWVSSEGFFVYDGTVRELFPEVDDYYQDRVTQTQQGKIACGHNPQFNEIWVFYPSNDPANLENDSYIIWNYDEDTWAVGEGVSRSSWNEASIWGSPVGVDSRVTFEAEEINFQLSVFSGTSSPEPGTTILNTYIIDKWISVLDQAYWDSDINPPSSIRFVAAELDGDVLIDFVAATEGVDYEFDEAHGLIMFLSGGAIDSVDPASFNLSCTVNILASKYTFVYFHEQGYLNDGNSRNDDVYLELAPMEIGNGDHIANVYRVVQDTGREDDLDPLLNSDAVEVEFDYRFSPEGPKQTAGPYQFDTQRGYTDVRFSGRQVVMRIKQIKDQLWRIGKYRLEFKQGSKR